MARFSISLRKSNLTFTKHRVPSVSLTLLFQLHPCDALSYWAKTGQHAFPSLKYVAQQVLGNQPSAAPVERDFSGFGGLVTSDRSRMDTYWAEMVMFIQANFHLIPAYNDIPMVDAKDIRKCLPARFNGKDTDLLEAEAALDPLSNNISPAEEGVGLD